MHTARWARLVDTVDWGIPMAAATRSRTRAVELTGLEPPDGLPGRLGAVDARGLTAEKARVALMVALGTGSAQTARDWFARL